MRQSALAISTLIALSAAAATGVSSKALCGARGYDKTEGGFQGWQATFDACSAECKKYSDCKSFSIGNKECNLYSVSVRDNLDPVSDSPYAFYDVSCTASSSSSSTKSSSTSTKSTSSAKTSTSSISNSTNTSITGSSINTSSTKTTTRSTTSKSVTTTSATSPTTTVSSSSTSSTSTPPCPLPTFVVTNFKWFNSTHNADCAANAPDVGDGTGCLDSNNNWCDPKTVANCTYCGINVCYTGLPTQPVGYGPPDYISADISNIGSCRQANPGTTPRREVGNDVVRCGGSQIQFVFHGDSNQAHSVANFYMQNQHSCGDGSGYTASGSGQAAITCTYDSGRNATCTLDDPSFAVPATQWGGAYYPRDD